MIYIAGDTHGSADINKLKLIRKLQDIPLTRTDYCIILGDTGILWHNNEKDRELISWYHKNLPYNILFIDGNHDNHEALNSIRVEEWHGGKVHRINDQILHLMRGQVYNIDGKVFFTMGGGFSVDKQYRIDGKSWWKEELPNEKEYDEARWNLDKVDFKVDYILTHEAPEQFLSDIIPDWAKVEFGNIEPNELNYFFNRIYDDITFNKWYCGHYHNDVRVNELFSCLYQDIVHLPK